MGAIRIILRSLQHYWRTGLAVAFGIAVATAVLTGSLLVGESMRGSIRDMSLARLGGIEQAMVSPHYFSEALAARMSAAADRGGKTVPSVITRSAARHAESGLTVPNVSVVGVDEAFWGLFGVPALQLMGRQVAINQSLADDLGVRVGDAVLLNVDRQLATSDETLFARRKRQETLRTLRLEVVRILPDAGVGGFSLGAFGGAPPRNLFVSRQWLNGGLGKAARANALLAGSDGTGDLRSSLRAAATLNDYGLKLVADPGGAIHVQSSRLVLSDAELRAIHDAAIERQARAADTSVYLATTIRKTTGESRNISYAIMAAVDVPGTPRAATGPDLLMHDPRPNPLPEGEGEERMGEGAHATVRSSTVPVQDLATVQPDAQGIVLNRWAAEDLAAAAGDAVEVRYLLPSRDGTHPEGGLTLTVRGVVDLSGPAGERHLMPEIEGVTDADRVDEWDAPFPVDMSRVTQRDEAYWDRYRATPKAFINAQTMRAIWAAASSGRSSGYVTGVRVSAPAGSDLDAFQQELAQAIQQRLAPADAGLVFRPVREMALAASAGSTDFGMLFVAMSLFLVIAAAGLAGALVRLNVERRAAEVGMMLACGVGPRTVFGVVVGEGVLIALGASVAGAPLGVVYAWGIISAMRRWWLSPWGSPPLTLHVDPQILLWGVVCGLVIGLSCAGWGVWMLRRRPVLQLLSGWRATWALSAAAPPIPSPATPGEASGLGGCPRAGRVRVLLRPPCDFWGRRRRWSGAAPWLLLTLAGGLVGLSGLNLISPHLAFFGGGACLLVAVLCAARQWLDYAMRRWRGRVSVARLAVRTAAANPGRSLLSMGLFACASFILVTVAANRRDFSRSGVGEPQSGTGGFALRGVTTLPLRYDLSTAGGRAQLGIAAMDEDVFRNVTVMPFLITDGDDISCLNLARPVQPRVLGVSDAMIRRGGFGVKTWREPTDGNPWSLLAGEDDPDGAIPVFGDVESLQWILHIGLGDIYTMAGPDGSTVRLRIAGTIPGSIFAGELLMGEKQFHRAFSKAPASARYFLFATEPANEVPLAETLRSSLSEMGMEVRPTRQILNSVVAVQNVYLSMFLALGGLGVVLGTVGMLAVLLRSLFERRPELAIMLASGLPRARLVWMAVVEHGGLLAGGLLGGAAAALVASAPALWSVQASVDWTALVAVLTGVFSVGLMSCALAAWLALRGDLIPALREE